MTRRLGWIGVMAAILAGGGAARAQYEGVTSARHDLNLAFTVAGRISEVGVEPGQRVAAGAVLARLDDEEGRAAVELQRLRAESDLSVQAAEAEWRLAAVEEGLKREALAKGGAGAFEVEKAQLETKLALLSLEMAKQRRLEAARELRVAEVRHAQYALAAPMAGVIEEVRVATGETVEPLKPVLRLVVTDPLRVDVYVPTERTLGLKPGAKAWIRFPAPAGDGASSEEGVLVECVLVHVAQVADARSETRLVRVEAANRAGLPAGQHVRVYFDEGLARGAGAARPRG